MVDWRRGIVAALAIVLVGGGAWADPSSPPEPAAANAASAERLLFGFEPNEPALTWQTTGDVKTATVPVADAPAMPLPAATGAALSILAGPESGLGTRMEGWPADGRGLRALSLWVHRSRAEAERRPGGRMEIHLIEPDGRARFRRLVEFSHEGWARVTLPLRWFRWGDGRVPRWDRIGRIAFRFPDGAELLLDTITLVAGDPPWVPAPTLAELREIAFPDSDRTVKCVESPDVLLLSGAPELDADALAARLSEVRKAVYATFPFLDPPVAVPAVIVFPTQEDYQAFPARFARRLNATAGAPQSGGYTIQGIATSYWDAALGQGRPVYAHEYVHALLSQAAQLNNHGEWVQEGLATLFQLRFHPQEDIADLVRAGIADPKRHLPLRTLCNGEAIPMPRYWQAMTVCQALLAHDTLSAKLPALFRAFQERGSTDLGPLLEPVLGTTWEGLTAIWLEHCRREYAGK